EYRAAQSPERREFAATVLADYAAGRPDVLADLLLDADPKQYAVLFPVVEKYRAQAVAAMRRAGRGGGVWGGPARAAGRAGGAAADGLLADGWALCQTLPLGRWPAVAEGLRASGYRPLRLRPWGQEGQVRVAAVWVRDGRAFQTQTGLTAAALKERDAVFQKGGLIPADVAGHGRG